jgi:hypothetical protein
MIRPVLPVAAVIVLLAGCGGSRAKDTPAATTGPEPKAEPAPAPATAAAEPAKPTKRKKGEPEPAPAPAIDQPAAPELPAIDLAVTPEMLSAHALVVAREQVEAGLAGAADITQRHAFIVATWQPLYQARIAELNEIAAAREARVKRGLASAKLAAEHEGRLDAVDAEYAPKIRAERAKTAPILDR